MMIRFSHLPTRRAAAAAAARKHRWLSNTASTTAAAAASLQNDPTLTRRWSMRSLAQLGQEKHSLASSTAKIMLQDVRLRLAGQTKMCTKLMEEVTNMTEYPQEESSAESPSNTNNNNNVIRAVNQPVTLSIKTMMQQRANLEQECQKAHRQLHNLQVLHSDTHNLTKQLLENNQKLLDRFSPADQHLVAATMEQVRSRHATTVETLADICIGLEQAVRESKTREQQLHRQDNLFTLVTKFLEGRLGVQLLCDHYVALDKGKPTGGVAVDCLLHDVVEDAVTEAKHMCDANFNMAPDVVLNKNLQQQRVTLVRPWVHHALVEVLKNAMVSSVKRTTTAQGNNSTALPPPIYIETRLENDDHYLCLDVIDQGVGLNQQDVAFGFAQSSARQRWDRLEEQQSYAMVRSPLQSLGVGLPLSRIMMRHFGGDVAVENRSFSKAMDSGCTATIKLPTDDTILEKLPAQFQENE